MIKTKPIEWLEALVEEIDIEQGIALCIVKGGQHLNVPLNPRRAKGALPQPGERWLIDRALAGAWTFAAVLNDIPPAITGSRQANPALASALDALAALGLLEDQTTAGSAPGGGGVTDHGALTGLGDDDHTQYAKSDGSRGAFASEAQGDLADSSVQPGDLPSFGTAAEADTTDFDAAGAATSAVSGHVGAADPHGDRAYAASLFASNDALVYKGSIDCSANPNYPAADAGHTYRVSVAGKIGGGSGPSVEAGDLLHCFTDSSAAGDHATVGANWTIGQVNVDGAVIGPAGSTDAHVALWDGTSGRLLKDGGATGAAGLALLSSATTSDVRTYLGLVLGTHVQAFHANLTAFSGLTLVADQLPYANGTGTLALTTFSSFARTLVDDANAAAAQATLGVPPTTRQLNGVDLSADRTLPNMEWLPAPIPCFIAWSEANHTPVRNINSARWLGGYLDTDAAGTAGRYIGWKKVLDAGTWSMLSFYDALAQNGTVTITIDGVSVGSFSMYNASTLAGQVNTITGITISSNGLHTIRATNTGTSGGGVGSNYGMRWEAIQFIRTA